MFLGGGRVVKLDRPGLNCPVKFYVANVKL